MSVFDSTGQKPSGTADGETLPEQQHRTIKIHAVELDRQLPDGGEPFSFSERASVDCAAADLPEWLWRKLWSTGVVDRVDKVRSRNGGSMVSIWTMAPAKRAYVRRHADQTESLFECGHSGIDNRDGGGFSCGRDYCDIEVPRAEVQL
jgi:hypothetical protein